MEQTKEEIKKVEKAEPKFKKVKKEIVLKNTAGKEMDPADYFFSDGGEEEVKAGSIYPSYFNKTCGTPVEREDLIAVFDKIFNPEDNYLFYKQRESEVYLVVVPLKFSSTVGLDQNSLSGDYQKHSMSFIAEGAVNLETLKAKLKRIATFIKNAQEDK